MKEKPDSFISNQEIAKLGDYRKLLKKQNAGGTSILKFPYGTQVPMMVTKVEKTEHGTKVYVKCIVDGKKIHKVFHFSDNYPYYLEKLIDVINPDAEVVEDIIGVPFWGEVNRSGPYENVRALELDEIDESENEDEEEEIDG